VTTIFDMPNTHPSGRLDYSVSALLYLSAESERQLRDFFIRSARVAERFLHRHLHMTVYHAPRHLDGVTDAVENLAITVEPSYWRFMVMKPGARTRGPILFRQNPKLASGSIAVLTPTRRFRTCARASMPLKSRMLWVNESPAVRARMHLERGTSSHT
jgi:hypothetical protein